MKISILTLFPEMFDGFKSTSIINKALNNNQATVDIVNYREYSLDKHKHVDDTPYGGGQGMVIACQPVVDCLKNIKTDSSKIYLMDPTGDTLNQKMVRELASNDHIILVCGHYEGFDNRINNYIDGSISIGDYILTGGELPAMVISDAIIRTLDGVITDESSVDESFENGLLEYPQYTKPPVYDGYEVPEVLLSGHHENIRKFRLKESLRKTLQLRPDLLENREFTKEELKLLDELKND